MTVWNIVEKLDRLKELILAVQLRGHDLSDEEIDEVVDYLMEYRDRLHNLKVVD